MVVRTPARKNKPVLKIDTSADIEEMVALFETQPGSMYLGSVDDGNNKGGLLRTKDGLYFLVLIDTAYLLPKNEVEEAILKESALW